MAVNVMVNGNICEQPSWRMGRCEARIWIHAGCLQSACFFFSFLKKASVFMFTFPDFILHFLTIWKSWRVVNLQGCVSFRCAAKWFRCIYIFISILSRFFIIIGYYQILNIVPFTVRRSLLFTCFIYSSTCSWSSLCIITGVHPFAMEKVQNGGGRPGGAALKTDQLPSTCVTSVGCPR